MRSHRPAPALPLALALCAAAPHAGWRDAAAQAPSGAVVFGDSLSDDGNIPDRFGVPFPPPPYDGGRFSNGPVWAEYWRAEIGLPPDADANLAVGGAFAGRENALNGEPALRALGVRLPGLLDQVDGFLAGGRAADPSAVHVLWAGSNDAIALVGDVAALPPEAAAARLGAGAEAAAADLEAAARRLVAAGARRLLVPNVPDLGRVPDEDLSAAGPTASAVAAAVNAAVARRMAAVAAETGAAVEVFDAAGLLRAVADDPEAFGFAVADRPCLEAAACVLGGRAVQDRYVFFDDLHPTTRAHAIIARAVASGMAAPGTVAPQAPLADAGTRLAAGLVAARQALRRTGAAAAAFLPFADGGGALPPDAAAVLGGGGPGVSAFATAGRSWGSVGARPGAAGFEWTQDAVALGADAVVRDGLLVGVAAGWVRGDADLAGGAGTVERDGPFGGGFASLYGDVWYVDVAASASRDAYRIRRETFVGGLAAEAEPGGWTLTAEAEAGLRLPLGDAAGAEVRAGPFAGLRWARASIDGYDEQGAGVLGRTVGAQTAVARTAVLGVHADAAIRAGEGVEIRPHARLALERALGDGGRTVSSRPTGSAGPAVASPVAADDRTRGRAAAGLVLSFGGRLAVDVEASAVLGDADARERAVSARVRWRF
jgi:outer membrane lipase/esterase